MKKLFFILLLSGIAHISSRANFINAKISVTGVTCSMCSNSVHKALSSLDFIDKIDVDLENAVFVVSFRSDKEVSMDAIKSKVEGAGFSVGEIIAGFKFDQLAIKNDLHFQYQSNTYHFINVKEQELKGLVQLRFVDKGLTGIKEHKKYVKLTTYKCIKSGKIESCCHTTSGNRVYHVTL